MAYLKETIRGVSWMAALRASVRSLTFLKFIVLARILLPEEFGLFGIASLMLAFLEIITETGINFFLIQEKEKLSEFVNTAWVISIVRGIFISILLLIFSPLVASFFDSPEAIRLLKIISLVPFLRGFINPSIVKFQKDLKFSKEFFLRSSVFFVDTLAAIFFAFLTRSAVSLVYGMVVGVLFELLISFVFVNPRPRLIIETTKIKRVLSHAKWVNLALIFNYLFQEGDDIVVGKLLNSTALGVYQIAYKISTLPITEVADVVIKVTLPVYSKISENRKELKSAFLKTLFGVFLVVTPFGILLYLFPNVLVMIFLGDNWTAAIPVIKLLSFFGVVRALTACTYPLLISLKKVRYVTYTTLIGIIGLGIFVLPLVTKYGVEGAAWSALIGALLALPTSFLFVYKAFKS